MTTAKNDDRNALRDSHVDAAWRAASREEPPAALDAAVLAAARREVGAGPQSTRKQDAMRADRWWWPLAVAATLGAITVGLLQTVAPDRLGAPALDNAVVTDMPMPVAKPAPETAPPTPAAKPAPETPTPTPAVKPAPESVTPTPRQEATTPGGGNKAGDGRATARGEEPLRKATAERATPRADASRSPEPVATAPLEKKRENAPRDSIALPEPFPAAAQPRPAAPADAAAARSPAVAGAIAPPSAPTEPTPPKTATADSTSERTPPARDTVAPAQSSASRASPLPPAAVPGAQRFQESAAARPAPIGKMAAGSTAIGKAEEARVKDRAPLPVAEWIALIRRLRAEGNTEDAARELAAFRVAHIDHEKLLPPDLRDWRPPDK